MIERLEANGRELVLNFQDPLTEELRMHFRRRMERALEESFQTITLEFSDVRVLSSSWIGSILLFRGKLKETGRTLRIRGCSRELHKVLLLIRLDTILPIEA